MGMEAFGGLISAGIGLAAAVANKPYYAVQQYETKQYAVKKYNYTTAPVPDNSVAVYNRAYSKMTAKMNSLEVMFRGERNITAAALKGVKERTAIGLSQDEAEANVRLNAAASGVKGGNVDDAVYQTHANVAFRLSDQAASETNSVQAALADVYKGYQGSMMPEDDYTVEAQFTGRDTISNGVGHSDFGASNISGSDNSLAGSIMTGLSFFDNSFFKDLGLAMEDINDAGQPDFAVGNDWNNTVNPGQA
jgi:hypothetical protein